MQQDNPYLHVIREHYSNALDTNDTIDRLLALMHTHLGLAPRHIVAADSICCDDLNTIEYPQHAYEMLGPFKMGGLNGFPFAGLTGMGAFVHHVPAEGAVFLFYAPHIGITMEGSLGEILRPGQTKPSTCCGAAKAALGKLLKDEIKPGEITDLDYQQNTIEQIFLAQKERIASAPIPIKEATDVMYEAIGERVDILTGRTQYVCRYLVLLGGILINASEDMGSFFSARRLECRDLKSGKHRDYLSELLA